VRLCTKSNEVKEPAAHFQTLATSHIQVSTSEKPTNPIEHQLRAKLAILLVTTHVESASPHAFIGARAFHEPEFAVGGAPRAKSEENHEMRGSSVGIGSEVEKAGMVTSLGLLRQVSYRQVPVTLHHAVLDEQCARAIC